MIRAASSLRYLSAARVVAAAPTSASVRAIAVSSSTTATRRQVFGVGSAVRAVGPATAVNWNTLAVVRPSTPSRSINTDALNTQMEKLVKKWKESSIDSIMHQTNYALLVLTPVALTLSPSIINFPVDLALGVIIPVHMHIGLSTVITDYVPRPLQQLSILGIGLVSALVVLGLLKINLCGPGITESVKSLWRKPKKKEEKKTIVKVVEEPKEDKKVVAAPEKKQEDKIKIEVVEEEEKPKKKKVAKKE